VNGTKPITLNSVLIRIAWGAFSVCRRLSG
jgi:hypothetical protein